MPTFVVAGSGEAREGGASYRERTVRYGETSADAMREKAVYVLGEMERRLKLLGFAWPHTTATQVYTVHDLHPFLADEIVRRGAARAGLDLALLPPARARPRIRDGLPRHRRRAFRRVRLSRDCRSAPRVARSCAGVRLPALARGLTDRPSLSTHLRNHRKAPGRRPNASAHVHRRGRRLYRGCARRGARRSRHQDRHDLRLHRPVRRRRLQARGHRQQDRHRHGQREGRRRGPQDHHDRGRRAVQDRRRHQRGRAAA